MLGVMYDGDASTDDPRLLPLLLSVKQASELLNVSDHHVRRLCADGTIRAAKVGSSWRIGRDALLEQFGIVGVRRGDSSPIALTEERTPGDKAEIVIRIELPAELAKRLADARVVVATSSGPAR